MANNKGNQIIPNNKGKKNKRHAPYDPRVDMFKSFYLRPDSYTFFNARQSALRAGYTEQYSNNITSQQPSWYVDMLESADHKRAAMLKAAEDNLLETVQSKSDDRDDRKLKHDATKFVSERLGKQHYSTRQEVTGADGRAIFSNDEREANKLPLNQLFAGVSEDT